MTFIFEPIYEDSQQQSASNSLTEINDTVAEQILGAYLFYLSENLSQRNTIKLEPILDSNGNQVIDSDGNPLNNEIETIDRTQAIVSEPITDLSLTVRDGQTQLIRTISFDLFLKTLNEFDPNSLV